MNLCDSSHDEVCFEGRTCPVCERDIKISDLEDQISELTDEIKGLKEEAK